MLFFFRKLRRSLIGSDRVNKYVLYAIGEITLVVVRILMALGINNWNEERKDRLREEILLEEITQEFQYNKKEFFTNPTDIIVSDKTCRWLLNTCQSISKM